MAVSPTSYNTNIQHNNAMTVRGVNILSLTRYEVSFPAQNPGLVMENQPKTYGSGNLRLWKELTTVD